jgi:aromatase
MVARTDNSVVIDAPLALVWSRTNDVAAWPRLFTEYAGAQVLAEDASRVRFRLTLHPDENGTSWSWISERVADPETRVVIAHRVETGPFRFMHIRWTYDEVEGGVLMRWTQEFEMRPGAPLDDAAMAARIDASSPVQMAAIRSTLEAEARRVSDASQPSWT